MFMVLFDDYYMSLAESSFNKSNGGSVSKIVIKVMSLL